MSDRNPPVLVLLPTRRDPGGNSVRYNGLMANYQSFLKQDYKGEKYFLVVDTSPDGEHQDLKEMIDLGDSRSAYLHFASVPEGKQKYGREFPEAAATLLDGEDRNSPYMQRKLAEHTERRPEVPLYKDRVTDQKPGIGMGRNFGIEAGRQLFNLPENAIISVWDDDDKYGDHFLSNTVGQLQKDHADCGRFHQNPIYAYNSDASKRYVTYQETPPIDAAFHCDPALPRWIIAPQVTGHHTPVHSLGFPASGETAEHVAHLVKQGVPPEAAQAFYDQAIQNRRNERYRSQAIEEGPTFTFRLSIYDKISQANQAQGGPRGAFHYLMPYEDMHFLEAVQEHGGKMTAFKTPFHKADGSLNEAPDFVRVFSATNSSPLLVADEKALPVPPAYAQIFAHLDHKPAEPVPVPLAHIPPPSRDWTQSPLQTITSMAGRFRDRFHIPPTVPQEQQTLIAGD